MRSRLAEDLHRLRKRAKGSRYALETMLAIDEKQLGGMLKSLEDLQDLVGGYHDAVVAVAWIKGIRGLARASRQCRIRMRRAGASDCAR